MSLITRCPACGTMFKVVPDQLRISEGWVRCGKCSEVFDAARNLQVLNPPPHAVAARQKPPALTPGLSPRPVSELLKKHPHERPGGSMLGPDARQHDVPHSRGIGSGPAVSAADTPEPFVPHPVVASSLLVSKEKVSPPAPEDVDALESIFHPEALTLQAPAGVSPASVARAQDSVTDEDVSFVREARRKAFWRKPLMRFVLVTFVVALLGALALQVAVQERDRLASLEPRLRPWLTLLCNFVGCRVDVLRQIDAVIIENSSFTRIRGDLFRLGFSIRNTASVEVATPALELTLTDAQDRPVIRRVFRPAELGASTTLLAKGEWSAALNLGATSVGDNGRIAGYRLLAFYP